MFFYFYCRFYKFKFKEIYLILLHFICFLYFYFILGNHAIGAVRKFPTLPLNASGGGGVWIDPAGGVWRQANTTSSSSCTTKEQLPDYSQVAGQTTQQHQQQQHHMPLPDYER